MSELPALPKGGFTVPINGFDMYCEAEGEGPLLVFLPGGMVGVDMHRALVETLRRRFTVLTADANGQGRSTLGPGPITYVSMAADMVALFDRLQIQAADCFGLGDGGCCGLHMLIDFSHRVRSVSLCGTPWSHSAYTDFGRAFVKHIADHAAEPKGFLKMFAGAYASYSPHPEQFEEMIRRLAVTWASEPNFTRPALSAIEKPTLVISSDRDEFVLEAEFRRMASLIPQSTLVQIPGMGHVPGIFADDVAEAVATFIDGL